MFSQAPRSGEPHRPSNGSSVCACDPKEGYANGPSSHDCHTEYGTLVQVSHLATAQCSECRSIFEIDQAVALNAFAVLSGAIVLLFKSCGSRF